MSALDELGALVRGSVPGDVGFITIAVEGALIVACRGTRVDGFKFPITETKGFAVNWADLLTDANFLPDKIDEGVFAHAGFVRAFRSIEGELENAIQSVPNDTPLWFTGHSLGAAITSLAAYKYRNRPGALYTSGSPRVGNDRFADTLLRQMPAVYRFVHNRDFVTTVPPAGLPLMVNPGAWLDFLNPFGAHTSGYTHVGTLKFITGRGTSEVKDGESAKNDLLSLAGDAFSFAAEMGDVITRNFAPLDPSQWPVSFEAVADHAPVYYANKLFNACERESAPARAR